MIEVMRFLYVAVSWGSLVTVLRSVERLSILNTPVYFFSVFGTFTRGSTRCP